MLPDLLLRIPPEVTFPQFSQRTTLTPHRRADLLLALEVAGVGIRLTSRARLSVAGPEGAPALLSPGATPSRSHAERGCVASPPKEQSYKKSRQLQVANICAYFVKNLANRRSIPTYSYVFLPIRG